MMNVAKIVSMTPGLVILKYCILVLITLLQLIMFFFKLCSLKKMDLLFKLANYSGCLININIPMCAFSGEWVQRENDSLRWHVLLVNLPVGHRVHDFSTHSCLRSTQPLF